MWTSTRGSVLIERAAGAELEDTPAPAIEEQQLGAGRARTRSNNRVRTARVAGSDCGRDGRGVREVPNRPAEDRDSCQSSARCALDRDRNEGHKQNKRGPVRRRPRVGSREADESAGGGRSFLKGSKPVARTLESRPGPVSHRARRWPLIGFQSIGGGRVNTAARVFAHEKRKRETGVQQQLATSSSFEEAACSPYLTVGYICM